MVLDRLYIPQADANYGAASETVPRNLYYKPCQTMQHGDDVLALQEQLNR